MRTHYLCTAALAAVLVAQPASAQETAPVADTDSALGDIVVTAQRRSESLQDAAIAIDSVSAESLADRGVSSASDITKIVPAISMPVATSSVASIFIRGVGNITTSSYNDPAVVPSYDGVVLGRGSGVFGAAFYDLERIEVLKGPQGILYGRNATAGAVNVIPTRPQIGRTGAGFSIGYGNFDAVEGEGYINLATGENSALRVAGSYLEHDGYNRDGSDDAKRGSLRGQFLIEPNDDLSLRFGADWTHIGGIGVGGSYIGSFLPGPNGYTFVPSGLDSSEGFDTPAANAYRQTNIGAPGFGFLSPLNAPQSVDVTYWGVSAELNWDAGLGTLTVLPAYRESDDASFFSGPAFNTANTNEQVQQFSIETRFAGDVGLFDYVVGGFYFNEKIEANNQYNQEFVLPIVDYRHDTDSWAIFGQLTANLSENLRLIGGARYTEDRKSINGLINNFITFCGGIPPVAPPDSFAIGCADPAALPRYGNFLNAADTLDWLIANDWVPADSTLEAFPQVFPLLSGAGLILKTHNPVIDSGTYSQVTWRISAEYDVSEDNLFYATVETGYRAGGFQMTEGRTSYNPEFITAYTLGSKNRFLDDHLQVNLEAFWWKYRDQQITYFTVDSNGTLISSNENAGRSTIKGFDIDVVGKPTRTTTINAKVQYLDSEYNDLHLFTAAPRDNFNCPFTFTGQIAGGAPVKDFNCSGNPLLFSPQWTLNLGIEQVFALTGGLDLVVNANTAWRDDQFGSFEYLDFERIPAYWTTDLSLTLAADSWSLSAYVRNLEDKRRNLAPQASPIGFAVGHYSAPQTYGLRLSAEF